jgi:urease accessory protein
MKALARIVAEADGRGGTRLTELYGEAPLLPRRTGHGGPGPAEVHLVGGAAGPLGGDELFLELHVGAGATLVVRSVAATMALPGPGTSMTRVSATVDGRLKWLPEPIIAVRGCDHLAESVVELGSQATLIWREELVCGRHREPSGDLQVRTTVRRSGRTISRQDLAVGPRAPGWAGPAVLGGARAAGSLLEVGGPREPGTVHCDEYSAATMRLAPPDAVLTTAVACDAYQLRNALTHGRDRLPTRDPLGGR